MKRKNLIMIVFVMIAMLIVTCSISNIKAITDGETVSYTAKKGYHNDDGIYIQAKFTVGNYTGVCCESGNELSTSGNAKATKLSNNSKTAKIAYYYGIVKGWQNNGNKASAVIYSSTTQSYHSVLTSLVQISQMGKSDWKQAQIDMGDNGAQPSLREAIFSIYDETNWNAINVPSNFEIFKANPTDGSQDFAVWRYAPFEASKTYASGSKGAGGAKVRVGEEIAYQIAWTGGSGSVTITDTISTGLQFSSVPSGCSTSGQTMTCTSTSENGTITYKAKVTDAAEAQAKVCNSATATTSSGSIAKDLGKLCNPVPSKHYASNTANGKDNASVKVGDIITYNIKYANVTSTSQVIKITDTISAGLEFVESNYAKDSSSTASTLIWNRTLAAGASETLTYKVRVVDAAVYKVCNNAKVKFGNNSDFALTQLCNPVPKKEYGGTSLNDNKGWNHHEVLMPDTLKQRPGDDIKYKITLANVKSTAQTVVVTDVLSKGLTYNEDATITNGTITSQADPKTNSDTKETTIVLTVSIPAGQTAVLNYSAKVNEDAVNIVNNNASCQYGTDPVIKLVELDNPVPKKQYDVDTANGMNGRIVQKDDLITYNISYANGFKKAATINLRDTLSKGLTYKAGTAKVCDYNKENCKSLEEAGMTEKVTVLNDGKTQILWTRTDMPSLGVEVIVYDVTVTGETIKVQNDFDIKSCEEATQQTIQIPDCQTQINKNCAPICNPETDKNCKAETDQECMTTKQECSYTGMVCNNPWMDIEELKNPVPVKEYDEKTPSGFGETAVAKGNRIRYRIRYANVAEGKVTVTIKDTLSKGITYIKGTSMVGDEKIADPAIKGQQLTWTRELEKDTEEALTYEVMITGEALIVNNNACMIYGNNPDYERCLIKLYNPVPQKTYAKDTKAGKNGAVVKKNDVISYSIKYSNVKKEKQTIIITDHLSKGLEYQKGTSKINGKAIEPDSVTKDANGTMLIWMTELDAGKHAELVYGARVTGEKMIVENNANIQYGHDPVIHLDELRNPLIKNEIVNVPDTGSKVAIAGVIAGVLLISGGGYVLYRRYKKV